MQYQEHVTSRESHCVCRMLTVEGKVSQNAGRLIHNSGPHRCEHIKPLILELHTQIYIINYYSSSTLLTTATQPWRHFFINNHTSYTAASTHTRISHTQKVLRSPTATITRLLCFRTLMPHHTEHLPPPHHISILQHHNIHHDRSCQSCSLRRQQSSSDEFRPPHELAPKTSK
jgi:hypothetical protein